MRPSRIPRVRIPRARISPARFPGSHREDARSAGRLHAAAALLAEALLLLAVYLLFTRVQNELGTHRMQALANAVRLQHLEARLHLDVEETVNSFTAAHLLLARLAADLYVTVLAWPPVALVLLRHRRPGEYRGLRTLLVVFSLASLPIFWAFPVAPPRLAQPGIHDLVEQYSILRSAMSPAADPHENLYAATPSLHVAWALWSSLALSRLADARRRWVRRAIIVLPPLAVCLDVLATGNHYLLDVLAGVALVLGTRMVLGSRVLLGRLEPSRLPRETAGRPR